MGERYWVTGVQLVIIWNGSDAMLDKVVEKQFIGNYPDDKDKKRFLKQIKALQMSESKGNNAVK